MYGTSATGCDCQIRRTTSETNPNKPQFFKKKICGLLNNWKGENVKTKKFRLIDAVLASVCIILTVESAAPAAAVGNAQYFWWISMLVLFFLPYGLISAELGTTYVGEGGIYDWVRFAFGSKWGCRVAWNYWVNFALWIASLAVLFKDTLLRIVPIEMTVIEETGLQLIFIWAIVYMTSKEISKSKWLMNLAAVFKAIIMILVGGLGIFYASHHGVATPITLRSIFPEFDLYSLSFVSIIIYNFVGFEIVTTLAADMDDPRKQIPPALLLGGIVIAIFYMFASFGIGVAIPVSELSTSTGLLDSIIFMIGNNWIVMMVGIMMLVTFIANIISWAYGSTYVAKYAADHDDLPAVFSKTNREGVPNYTPIVNGLIASALIIIVPFLPSQDVFWSFFGVGVVTLMLAYVLMFPAFLKLREINPERRRPFLVKGGKIKISLMAYIPMILIIISLIFTIIPMNTSKAELTTKLPLLVGVLISILIQEILVSRSTKKHMEIDHTIGLPANEEREVGRMA